MSLSYFSKIALYFNDVGPLSIMQICGTYSPWRVVSLQIIRRFEYLFLILHARCNFEFQERFLSQSYRLL